MERISYAALQKLERASLELLHATRSLGWDKTQYTKRIMESIRKIVIANEFVNKPLICISGLQGAGKTTLVKNLYKLPDELFNIDLGRSERIPILVTESSEHSDVCLCAVELEEKGDETRCIRRENLSVDEFKKASRGDTEESIVMYLEMIVPLTFESKKNVSFMLLPGYERKKDYWRNLVEFSVSCSDAAVFVFHQTSFSNAENDRILREIREEFGQRLIYVISHCDGCPDGGQSVKQTCMEVMDVADPERIVCAGSYMNQEENDQWIEALMTAINKYCNSFEESNARCARRIREEIDERLYSQIYDLEDKLKSDDGNEILMHLQNSNWLRAFDEAVADVREHYQDALDESLGSAVDNSLDAIRNEFTAQFAWLNTVKRTILGTSPKDVLKIRGIVKRALSSENDQLAGAQGCQDALQKFAMYLSKHNKVSSLLLETGEDTVLPATKGATARRLNEDAPLILTNARILLTPGGNGQSLQMTYSGRDTVEASITTIVEMATYYYCTMTEQAHKDIQNVNYAESVITGENVLEKAQSTKKVALGLLGIFGVDVVEDGSMNLIEKLAVAIGVPTQTIAIGAAVVTTVGTTAAVARDINRISRTDMQACEMAVIAAYERMKNDNLKNYDKYMRQIRRLMEENLIALTGNNQQALNKYNALRKIQDIKQVMDEISRQTEGAEYGLSAAFR